MATTPLVLHFEVSGTGVALANINRLSMGMLGAATELEGRWKRAADVMENGLHRVGTRLTNLAAIGSAIAVGGLYKMTSAMIDLGKASMNVNQRFQEFEITLGSSLKSAESARKIVQEVAKITASSPIPFKDIASSVTGLSVLPQLNARFVSQAQNDKLGDTDGLLRRSIRLIEMMTAFRPDKNPDEALFSIREALSGEFRSIQRRFDVPLSIFSNASGLSMPQLKERGPDAIFDALFKAFDNIVSSSAITAKAKLPSVTVENLMEQSFEQPSLAIGREGWNKTVNERLYKYLEKATEFFTENPEKPGSGKFVTEGFAKRISISASRIFTQIGNTLESTLNRILTNLGYGGRKEDILARASAAVADAFNYVATNLPQWTEQIKGIITLVADFFKQAWDWLKPMVSWLAEHPKLTIAAGLIGPNNLINWGASLATRAAFGGAAAMATGTSAVTGGLWTASRTLAVPNPTGPGLRLTDTGARHLRDEGYFNPRTGRDYTSGSRISAANLASVAPLPLFSPAGITSMATFLAKLGLVTAAIGGLAAVVYEGIKAFKDKAEADRIAEEARKGTQQVSTNMLSKFVDAPGGPEAIALNAKQNALLDKVKAQKVNPRLVDLAELIESVGGNFELEMREMDFGDTITTVPIQIMKVAGKSFEKVGDEFYSFMTELIHRIAKAKAEELSKRDGGSPVFREREGREALLPVLRDVAEFTDPLSVTEQRFGQQDFRARQRSVDQLAATRLSTENRSFIEEFSRSVDPTVQLRANMTEYVSTWERVNEQLRLAEKALEPMSQGEVERYLKSRVDALAKFANAFPKVESVELDGRPINVQGEITRLQTLLKDARGLPTAKASGVKELLSPDPFRSPSATEPQGFDVSWKGYSEARSPLRSRMNIKEQEQADLARSRATQSLDPLINMTASFLRISQTFQAESKKASFGPEFESAIKKFTDGLDSTAYLAERTGNGKLKPELDRMRELAPMLRIDTTGMSDYEANIAERDRLQTLIEYEKAQKRLTGLIIDQGVASGKTLEEMPEVTQAYAAQSLALKKGEQALTEYNQALKKSLDSVSLDFANRQNAGQRSLIDDARRSGRRVSGDLIRGNAEQDALTSSVNGFDSAKAGFLSQFQKGDDFMNFAREGIQAANLMENAFSTAFGNMVTGTETVSEAFKNMAVSISQELSRLLMKKAIMMMFNYAFGGPSGGGGGDVGDGLSDANMYFDGMAEGGFISKGRGGVDDVPALLMKGEYVLTKKAVDAIGVRNLDAINEGRIAKFSGGGAVGVSSFKLPEMTAHTQGNNYNFGDINYYGKGNSQSDKSGLEERDMRDFQRQHRAMTVQLIEEHERRRRRSGT